MDTLQGLIETFSAEPTTPVFRKLGVLLDLEQLRDARCIPFLLQVLQDGREPLEVRVRVVRMLRLVRCPGDARDSVGRELSELLTHHDSPDLRFAAALTLAEFTDVGGVPSALGNVALDASETLDLRYSALTSLEGARPTDESAELLHRLALDESLGPSARSLLARWQVP